MNKYIKVCGIVILVIFSFYYTEKVALYVQNNTPLKKEIIAYKKDNVVEYVNAEIDGDYIIPGINGLEVNVNKSYNKMKSYNVFNKSYIVYDQVKPEVSIYNHKNKIINKGNYKKNAVSIIINKNNNLTKYFDSKNINYDYIDKTNYCIITSKNDCSNSSKYIVKPTIYLFNNNFLKDLNSISRGFIIFISDDLSINYAYVLINYLKYNNLNILNINNHLSEKYQL